MRGKNKSNSRYLVVATAFACVLILLFDFLQTGESITGNTLSVKEMVVLSSLCEGHLFPNIFISIVSHINLCHLVSNLLLLIALGEALNNQYKRLTLLIVLIISGFLGSLVPFLLHSNIISMGLSGDTFGWIALFVVAYIRFDNKEHLLLSASVLLTTGVLLVSTFEPGKTNILLHVTGFICGMILELILKNVSLIKQKN